MKISRRSFIAGGITAGCAAIGTAAACLTTNDFEYSFHQLKLKNIGPDLDQFTIAVLSDLHYGPALPDSWIDELVQKVISQSVDLVLIAGDNIFIPNSAIAKAVAITRNEQYSHGSIYSLSKLIFANLARKLAMIQPKYGIFSVYGNHDHWTNPRAIRQAFNSVGIQHSTNAVHDINVGNSLLKIVAMDDYLTGIPKLPVASNPIEAQEVRILLTHNPDIFSKVLASRSFDFQLAIAGHTHGGQIKLPWIGPISYRIRDTRFGEGWTQIGNQHFFTSRGLGTVEIPHRINCRPELAFIKLINI